MKSLRKIRQVSRETINWQLLPINFWGKFARSTKLKKTINIHFAWNVPQLNWHASLWGKLNVPNFWYSRKLIENCIFFTKFSTENLWKNLPNTECNQRFISIHLNSIGTAYKGYSASELLQSSTCSFKKQGFSVSFTRNGPMKNFRFRSITTSSMELTSKQTDPTNAFVGKQRQV